MQHRIARINLDGIGRLAAAVQPRPLPRIAADGVTVLGAHCGALAGQCIETTTHHDHTSPMIGVPAPRGLGEALIDAQLAEYSEPDGSSSPALQVAWTGHLINVTPDEAIALAAQLEVFALRLSILGRHAQRAAEQHRTQQD